VDLSTELEECMDQLLEIYAPFAEPGRTWSRGGEPLDELVRRRDQALAKGQPEATRFKSLWSQWEATQPPQEERARIFQARNRIVELGLQVSRSDTSIQATLRRKVDELRQMAVASDGQSKAARAYASTRLR
jgi:hypothetical protein